jgi:predicted ATPase
LPSTAALRREQIKLQVMLITPLIHVRGYAAPETKAAAERARALIDQAELLGETTEDPLLLFSVLYSFWVHSYVAFNGNMMCELAIDFLSLAEKQSSTDALMVGHRLMGISLMTTGDILGGLPHFNRAITLYEPAKHRSLAGRFAVDAAVSSLCFKSWALWLLGYPDAALASATDALRDGREIAQAPTLMYALFYVMLPRIWCGDQANAKAHANELVVLADEKGTAFWKADGIRAQGYVLADAGKAADAIQTITSALVEWRATGSTLRVPTDLSYLADAQSTLRQFEQARRHIGEAIKTVETTDERWYEAEISRLAGEIEVKSSEANVVAAERYFERALAVARQQQAKSWELRAAMSLARLWRDQGEVQRARELLAPVYGWFTEGFDTRDLKDAKALLEQLAA